MVEDPDVAEVVAAELRLLDPAVRRSPAAVARLLDPRFREFGSSGTVWHRDAILGALAAEAAAPAVAEDLEVTRLGPDAVLVTYRARRSDRTTLRSSVWRRRRGRWALHFHQGTVCPG